MNKQKRKPSFFNLFMRAFLLNRLARLTSDPKQAMLIYDLLLELDKENEVLHQKTKPLNQ